MQSGKQGRFQDMNRMESAVIGLFPCRWPLFRPMI